MGYETWRHRFLRAGRRALLASLIYAADRAIADTWTWNNTTGNWSSTANWTPSATPSSGTASALVFGGSGTTGYISTNDLPSTLLLNQITLNNTSTATGTAAAQVLGGGISFLGTAPKVTQNQGGDFNLDSAILVNIPTLFTGNGTGLVTLNGVLSGEAMVTKDGPGTLRLGSVTQVSPAPSPSDNTFFGGFTINAGTLRFNNNADTGRTALRANRITFGTSGATLSCAGEIRCGELVGSSGSIVARELITPFGGHDLLINALGNATYGGSIDLLPSAGGTSFGKLSIRGVATQTLTGAININNDITLGWGSGLTLAGNAVVAGTSKGQVVMHGATFTLDNSAVNLTNRLQNDSAGTIGLETVGGGTFSMIGNAAGSSESVGSIELGNVAGTTERRSGALTINVTHTSTSGASVLAFGGYERVQSVSSRATVDFTARDGAGNAVALGQTGAKPRITIAGTVNMINGLIAASDGTTRQQVGWATVNSTDFATYGANGVAAVSTSAFPSTPSPTVNALLSTSGTISGTNALTLNSLKLSPSTGTQSLSITGTGALSTNAILLAGNNDFSIVNSGTATGGLTGPTSGPRQFFVQNAALAVGVSLGTSAPLVKAGDGLLTLTNAGNTNSTQFVTINAGAIRATPGVSLPRGPLELRGGVLEITPGGTFNGTFSRLLGSTTNNLNWRGDGGGTFGLSDYDKGSGGFAAVGAPAFVDLSTDVTDPAGPTNIEWETSYFIDSAHAMVLGSRRADNRIEMVDNFNLTATANLEYTARNVKVVDNPNSSNDFARLSGVISGLVYSDLLKTGSGTLELTGANTYLGGTIVAEGTLLINNASALGATNNAYILIGARSGSSSAALRTSHASGTLTITQNINVQAGPTGDAILGNGTVPGSTNAGNAVFSGDITLGNTGNSAGRQIRLTAEAGTTVTFSGAIRPVSGYTGAMSVDKIGGGTVTLSGVSGFTGATTVTAGTLRVDGSIAASSGVSVSSNASFVSGSSMTVKSLNLSAGSASASILAGALRVLTVGDGTSDTGLLDISGSGSKLDLNSGAMVLNFNSTGAGAGLRDTIKALIGTNNTGKIMSSRVTSANLANPNTPMGIGYALGNYTSVGLPSDATSIVARYTLVGDANLDGVVDVGDLGTALAPNYGSPSGNYWQSGDFNGDGAVDTSDLALLAANYGKTLTLPGEAIGNLNLNFQNDLAVAFASVPEPGTLGVLSLATLTLFKRRNRRNK